MQTSTVCMDMLMKTDEVHVIYATRFRLGNGSRISLRQELFEG